MRVTTLAVVVAASLHRTSRVQLCADMPELNARIDRYKGDAVRLLVLKAPLVPRQKLPLVVPMSFLLNVERGSRMVACGRHRSIHTHGVEVFARNITPREDGRLDVVLTTGPVCEVTELGVAEDLASPWLGRDARVRWLETLDDDVASLMSSRAIARSEALEPLLAEWTDKVRRSGRERFEGQINRVLEELGPMPVPHEVSNRCLWAAALINPQPPIGLANEVRPTVLMAANAEERLDAVELSIVDSIGRLEVGWV